MDCTAQLLTDAGDNWQNVAMDIIRGLDDRTRSLNPNEDTGRRGILRGLLAFLQGLGLEADEIFNQGFGLVNITIGTSVNKSALLADYGIAAAEANLVEQVLDLLKDDAFVVTYHQEPVILTCADMYAARGIETRDTEWGEKAHKLVDYSILMYGKTPRFGHYRSLIRARADGAVYIPFLLDPDTREDDDYFDEDSEL
jgi:hypothetical protein